jgi:hypothetical protein
MGPDKAAQRGQPLRDGPDFWPRPPCLIAAVCQHVVPVLPDATIWECATRNSVLQRAIAARGRKVIGTDKYPQDGSKALDFLADEPPADNLIAMTNPPFAALDDFIGRGLELFDAGRLRGFVLLLRHDHLTAGTRVAAFNRATWEVRCNWRRCGSPEPRGIRVGLSRRSIGDQTRNPSTHRAAADGAGGRWHGRYGIARRPCHADGATPALKISDAPARLGGVDVHCFAGCDWHAVKTALRDLRLLNDEAWASKPQSLVKIDPETVRVDCRKGLIKPRRLGTLWFIDKAEVQRLLGTAGIAAE